MNKRQFKKCLAKRKQKDDEMSIEFIQLIHQLTPEGYFALASAVADLRDNVISAKEFRSSIGEYTEKKLTIYNSEQRQEAVKELNSRLGYKAVL